MSSSLKTDLSYNRAMHIALRFIESIKELVHKVEIVGELRCKLPVVGSIEILVIPKYSSVLDDLTGEGSISLLLVKFPVWHPTLTRSGERYMQFQFETTWKTPSVRVGEEPRVEKGVVQIDLYSTEGVDFGRQMALKTGCRKFINITLAGRWSQMGWRSTKFGLRRKDECWEKGGKMEVRPDVDNTTMPPEFWEEEDLFDFLGFKTIAPNQRNRIYKHENILLQ